MSYTKALEEKNNFVLTIWPEHCIEGTHGQDVVPQLQSVIESWSVRRGVDAKYIKKVYRNIILFHKKFYL